MLSLFPDLLDWSWYVPFVFRLFLGIYLCSVGWTFIKSRDHIATKDDLRTWIFLGAVLFLLGLFFIAGLYVQALGSIGFALAVFALFLKWKKSPHANESLKFYLLIGLVSLSLIFLGPGPYSFDLPL